jgi:hypothetical protein
MYWNEWDNESMGMKGRAMNEGGGQVYYLEMVP